MTAVFLDTAGLRALWDRADQWHAAAEAAYAQIIAQRQHFLTTTFVLLECGNAAARRPYRTRAAQLRRTLEMRGEVVVPTQDDWNEAGKTYEQGDGGQAGIVDQVTFKVMRRLGLTDAFTNDKHFQAAGFVTLF
jgi:predicted nucleic acid-binding protein